VKKNPTISIYNGKRRGSELSDVTHGSSDADKLVNTNALDGDDSEDNEEYYTESKPIGRTVMKSSKLLDSSVGDYSNDDFEADGSPLKATAMGPSQPSAADIVEKERLNQVEMIMKRWSATEADVVVTQPSARDEAAEQAEILLEEAAKEEDEEYEDDYVRYLSTIDLIRFLTLLRDF